MLDDAFYTAEQCKGSIFARMASNRFEELVNIEAHSLVREFRTRKEGKGHKISFFAKKILDGRGLISDIKKPILDRILKMVAPVPGEKPVVAPKPKMIPNPIKRHIG